MPLYFILGSSITNQVETRNKVKTGLLLLVTVFALTSSTLYIAAPTLVKAMAQSPDLLEVTTDYIRVEIFGFFVQSVNDFLIIPVQLMKLNKVLLISLLLKMILTISLDIPALKINCGPPTANLWSDWSPQKRVNRDKLDQRQNVRKSRFSSTVLLITPLSTQNHHSKSVEFGSNFKFSQICQI